MFFLQSEFKDVSCLAHFRGGRSQNRTRWLQIVVKCALRNFVILIRLALSLCSHIMDEGHGELFSKAYHARLYKLFQFVRFGAGTTDKDIGSEEIFCQRRRQMKTLGRLQRTMKVLMASMNSSKLLEIAGGVRRNSENFSIYAICKLKNEFVFPPKLESSLVKRRRKGVFLAFVSW